MSCSKSALVATALLLVMAAPAVAEDLVGYYLPDDIAYDGSIPTPESVLGWQVGDWHVRPDLTVRYFEALAAASPRMALTRYGETHEQRPLLLAAFSSPANIARLEQIRTGHLRALANGEGAGDGRPAIVWMGYSVHGDESSGANAALVFAYHLAAARGEEIDAILADTIILVDPVINPDGLARFAGWANMHKGKQLVADGSHREHRQGWPGGRTNHYWFDLNRDWLLLTHPESRGRIAQFHRWRPNLLTDFHEMGTDSTYFFQPGVPSRQNPLTPAANLDLTRRVAEFHAAELDEIGSLYYTEESFDDFYYGKGSTYPDVHGCVGILFEQASSRGHLQEGPFGEVTFPFTIRNQVRTSLSSIKAAHALRTELLDWQAETVTTARSEADDGELGGWVFGHADDPAILFHMVDLLRRHQIEVHRLAEPVELDGQAFRPGSAFVVPAAQDQFRLATALFEQRTEFADPTFYDVSAWTLPLAFGVPFAGVPRGDWGGDLLGAPVTEPGFPVGTIEDAVPAADTYAYAFTWDSSAAPRALQRLLSAEVHAQVATRPFTGSTRAGPREFEPGTIVVPLGVQAADVAAVHALLRTVAARDGIDVHALTTGLTVAGVDLGSPSLVTIEPPRPLLIVDGGVSSGEAGEVWHLLDTRLGLPLPMVEMDRVGRLDLGDYTHLLMVGGSYGALGDGTAEAVRDWVRGGGILIATSSAVRWAERNVLRLSDSGRGGGDDGDSGTAGRPRSGPPRNARNDDDEDEEDDDVDDDDADDDDAAEDDKRPDDDEEGEHDAPPTYADYEDLRAQTLVSGTIFDTSLDRTHPLAFGIGTAHLPVFRRGTTIMDLDDDPFVNVAVYTDEPLLGGYASDENVEKIAGTAAAIARRSGGGTVVTIIDDPLFRGYWRGASRLFTNALYFGGAVKSTRRIGGEEMEAHENALEGGH